MCDEHASFDYGFAFGLSRRQDVQCPSTRGVWRVLGVGGLREFPRERAESARANLDGNARAPCSRARCTRANRDDHHRRRAPEQGHAPRDADTGHRADCPTSRCQGAACRRLAAVAARVSRAGDHARVGCREFDVATGTPLRPWNAADPANTSNFSTTLELESHHGGAGTPITVHFDGYSVFFANDKPSSFINANGSADRCGSP